MQIFIVFTAAMYSRTKQRRDGQKEFWGHALNIMNDIEQNSSYATKEASSSPPGPTLSHEDVKELAKHPMPKVLHSMTLVTAKILAQMKLNIFYTTSKLGFISSDSPCIALDSNPDKQLLALGSPSIEITFPISPQLLALFSWDSPKELYVEIAENAVDNINRRTRFFCYEYFVVNQNVKKDLWF